MRARSATSEDTPRRLASREPDDVDEEDETIDLAEAVRGRRSEKPGPETSQDSSLARRFPIDPAYTQQAHASRQALTESFGQDASAPERLLIDLVAKELPVHAALVDAEVQLVARLPHLMDEARHVHVLARALREVTIVSHAVSRRIEGLLGTAVALRAQRRLVELHRSSRQ